MTDWVIEPFNKYHERTDFSCGQPPLDDFLRTRVSQHEKRRLGKTFVAVVSGSRRVEGYYTLAASAIAFEHLPGAHARKLPTHPVPVVLLGRLAVDQLAQGKRLGEKLLLDALRRTVDLSARLRIHALLVHALDERAARFYRKYGFLALADDPLHLYLPLATFEKLW